MLIDAVRRRNANLKAFAQELRISLAILASMNRRFFIPESIPSELKRMICHALDVSIDEIDHYLSLPPVVGRMPVVQSSFIECVEQDLQITESDRAFWLDVKE